MRRKTLKPNKKSESKEGDKGNGWKEHLCVISKSDLISIWMVLGGLGGLGGLLKFIGFPRFALSDALYNSDTARAILGGGGSRYS